MPSPVSAANEVVIFERLIESGEKSLSPAAARYFLGLAFQPHDVERMKFLSHKAQEGTLTAAEEAEIDGYELVGHLLSILKSKARKILKRTRHSS